MGTGGDSTGAGAENVNSPVDAAVVEACSIVLHKSKIAAIFKPGRMHLTKKER